MTREDLIRETVKEVTEERNAAKETKNTNYAQMAELNLNHLSKLYDFYHTTSLTDNPSIDKIRYAQDAKAISSGKKGIEALLSLRKEVSSKDQFSQKELTDLLDQYLLQVLAS